jgi:hypothetical protein
MLNNISPHNRLRRRASLLVDPLNIEYSITPLWRSPRAVELPVRQRPDGKLEALDNAALVELQSSGRSVAVVALYDEVDGDDFVGLFAPRFRDDGYGYVFRRALRLPAEVK